MLNWLEIRFVMTPAKIIQPALPAAPSVIPTQEIGSGLVMLFLAVLFSRVTDRVAFLHLPLVLTLFCFGFSLISGTFYRAVTHRVGLYLTFLNFWILLAVPLSLWPGGSLHIAWNSWLKSFLVFGFTSGLLASTRSCSRAVYVIVTAILYTALYTWGLDREAFSRLGGDVNERFGDSNDLAQLMLVGMALAGWLVSDRRRTTISRIYALGALLIFGITMAKTGSRGGIIGLFGAVFALFVYSSLMGRIRIIVAGALLTVLSLGLLSWDIRQRYLTIFSGDPATSEAADVAVASTEGRRYLLRQSLLITLKHPLLGVGPGMFVEAENNNAMSNGLVHGLWHETHNMYTQVSTDAGIPALVAFCAAFVWCLRSLKRLRKRRNPDGTVPPVAQGAMWLSTSLWGLLTTGLFLSVASTPELASLLGFAVAFCRAAEAEEPLPQLAAPVFAGMPLENAATSCR
jgi:O-antigen ligase